MIKINNPLVLYYRKNMSLEEICKYLNKDPLDDDIVQALKDIIHFRWSSYAKENDPVVEKEKRLARDVFWICKTKGLKIVDLKNTGLQITTMRRVCKKYLSEDEMKLLLSHHGRQLDASYTRLNKSQYFEVWNKYMGYDENGVWLEKNQKTIAELAKEYNTTANTIKCAIDHVSRFKQKHAKENKK